MANASTRDARAGFAIYTQFGEDITLDAINARLAASGYGAIAQRTLTHYRNLVKAGFNRYISINRFDVARASRAYDNMSSLSRYRHRSTHRQVEILFTKETKYLELTGTMIEVSDAGGIVEFSSEEMMDKLRYFKPNSGDSVIVRSLGLDQHVEGVVVDRDLQSLPVSVEIEYTRLVSLDQLTAGVSLQTSPVWIRISAEDSVSPTIDVVGRRLHYFFDLLEGVRAVFNETGRQCHRVIYASPPTVEEIRLASPALLLLQLPPELLYLMPLPLVGGLYLLPKTIEMRKTWHEGTNEKKIGKLIDKVGVELDAGVRLKEIDIREREMDLSVRQELFERVRLSIRESSISDEQLRQIIDVYVRPPLRTIGHSDIREIDVIDRTPGDAGSDETDR